MNASINSFNKIIPIESLKFHVQYNNLNYLYKDLILVVKLKNKIFLSVKNHKLLKKNGAFEGLRKHRASKMTVLLKKRVH